MAAYGFGTGTPPNILERFKAISKGFNLITDYKDKLNLYLLHSDFLSLDITLYFHHTENEEDIFDKTELEYHIFIVPRTEEERRLFNIICICPNLARVYRLEQYDNYDFKGVLAQCIEIGKAEIDRTIKENSLPMEYVEAKIKDYNDKLENSNCHRIKNDFDLKKRTIEKQVYDSILRNEVINYDYFLSKEIISLHMPEGHMSVVRLGFGIINVHILHYLEGELNKFRNTDYLKEILQNQKIGINSSATRQLTNTLEFDNTTLTQIINMSDSFLENEKQLKLDGYITSENKWIDGRGRKGTKSVEDLANLILLLKEKGYFKPECKIEGKKKKWKDRDYKNFFEVRYGYELKEQLGKAKKDIQNRLKTAKIMFHYF
jgi:hypothetical protein